MKHHLIIIVCVAAVLGALLYAPLAADGAPYAKAVEKGTDKQTEKASAKATEKAEAETAEKAAAKTTEKTVEAPAKPKQVSVQSKKVKKATVTWEAVEGAEGYEIRYQLMEPKDKTSDKDSKAKASKTVPAETKTVTSGTKTTATLSNLLGNREYKVKIRSFQSESKKIYSDWSKAKTVTVKHDKWSDLQDKYAAKKKVKQLIFVKYKGNSKADLIVYGKVASSDASGSKGRAHSESAENSSGADGTKTESDTDADSGKDTSSGADSTKTESDTDTDTGKDTSSGADGAKTEADTDTDSGTDSNSSDDSRKKGAAASQTAASDDADAIASSVIWKKILSCDAYTGQNGIDKKKEGDRRTPTGDYNLTHAFGVNKDPGSKMNYIKLNKHLYWCGDKEHYNQMIDIRDHPHNCRGEHLIDYTKQYAYAMALDYNKKGTYKKGSAIFLHCTGYNPYTLGCVAVSQDNMKTILKKCGKNTKICIYEK